MGEVIRVHQFRGYAGRSEPENLIHVDTTERNGRRLFRVQAARKLLSDDLHPFAVDAEDATPEDPNDDVRSMQVTIRLVRNLVAWVDAHGSVNAATEGKPRPRGVLYNRDREGQPIPTTWVLGREVKIAPELRRVATEVALGDHGAAGWRLRAQHVVRGHWKWQAHGTGLRDRKRIHVEPYWRGPQGAEAWAHVYTTSSK